LSHALDAWALIEFLDGAEPSLSRIGGLLAEERPIMSWINLGEVADVLERRLGGAVAREWVAHIRGSLELDEPTPERVLEAASIKAAHRVSYADAFAVATAQAHGAVLLTGDPEILDADSGWQVEDLRR
jgi:predicted nucleic acid-binding protein